MIRIPVRAARPLASIGVALIAMVAASSISAQTSVAGDLPAAAQQMVASSIDKSLGSTGVKSDRSANDLGWDCLAAVALAEQGDARGKARARIIAGELMRDVVKSADGKPLGWTADIKDKRCPQGGYDAFGDGTCNPPGTVYAFQTGLAVACLASASKLLDDRALLGTAKAVFASWQPYLIPAAPCPDCAYFAMSNSPNDAGRYVRNMSVFMALAGASLDAAGDADAGSLTRRLMASELAETARGNKGYLGFMDPGWKKNPALEADRIENHAAAVAVVSMRVGELLDSSDYRQHGLRVWREWATCNNDRCKAATCSYWAADPARCQATHTAAHCAFRSADPLARERCTQYLEKIPAIGSFGLLAIAVDSPVEAPKQRKR
jgi:hypothetical protein